MPRPMPADPFDVLELPRHASLAQARAQYRRLALRHHPDRNPGDRSATERFRRILAAYRRIASGEVRAAERTPPPAPNPDRYGCARCGDSFPFPEACPRCGVALRDRSSGKMAAAADPAVEAMIAELEARPAPPEVDPLERLPVPAMIVGACLAMAVLLYQLGPVGPALLCVGFSAYVAALELHRRAAMAVQ